MTTQKILLQQGEHIGQIIESSFDSQRLMIQMMVQFENEITLPLEFKVDTKEGGKFLRDIHPGLIKDSSQLLDRRAWFFVELVTISTGRNKFGLNAIIDTAGAYYKRTPVAAARG
jgi:hypothetical protein